jgi:hypothetical protein
MKTIWAHTYHPFANNFDVVLVVMVILTGEAIFVKFGSVVGNM